MWQRKVMSKFPGSIIDRRPPSPVRAAAQGCSPPRLMSKLCSGLSVMAYDVRFWGVASTLVKSVARLLGECKRDGTPPVWTFVTV